MLQLSKPTADTPAADIDFLKKSIEDIVLNQRQAAEELNEAFRSYFGRTGVNQRRLSLHCQEDPWPWAGLSQWRDEVQAREEQWLEDNCHHVWQHFQEVQDDD